MTDRTVKVILEGDPDDLIKAFAEGVAAAKGFERGVDGTSTKVKDDFDGMGKSSNDFQKIVGKNMRDGQTAISSLQARSAELRTEITKLKTSFATNGHESVFGDLKSAQSELRGVEKVLRNIAPEGAEVGASWAQNFGDNAAKLLPELLTNPVGLAVAGAVTAVAVPIIGGAVAGAVAAGVGLGFIGLGAYIQKDNPIIQQAFGGLKQDAIDVFKGASEPIVEPIAHALDSVDRLLKQQGPQFKAIFSDVAPAIVPIVTMLETLETDILPGVEKVAEGFAKAVADPEVQRSVETLGSSFQALFNTIGNNPKVIADAFFALNGILETGVDVLNGFAHAASFVDSFFHTGSGHIKIAGVELKNTSNSTKDLAGSLNAVQHQLDGTAPKVTTTSHSIIDMSKSNHQASVSLFAMAEANTGAGKTLVDFGKSSDQAATGINNVSMRSERNTASLRQNKGALDNVIGANESYKVIAGATDGTVKKLTKTTDDGTNAIFGQIAAYNGLNVALNRTFDKYMSVEQATISVKQAQADLTKQLGKGTKSWDLNRQAGRDNWSQLLNSIQADKNAYDSQVALSGATKSNTSAYNKNVEALLAVASKAGLSKGKIAELRREFEALPPAINIPVTVRVRVAESPQAAQLLGSRTGQRIANRDGGVYTHARDGVLSQAKIESAVVGPGARYAYAEQGTGGEAFIPRYGDYNRRLSITQEVAGWLGQKLIPAWRGGTASGGDGASATYHSTVNVYPQKADFTTGDLDTLQQVQEIRQRIGRPY